MRTDQSLARYRSPASIFCGWRGLTFKVRVHSGKTGAVLVGGRGGVVVVAGADAVGDTDTDTVVVVVVISILVTGTVTVNSTVFDVVPVTVTVAVVNVTVAVGTSVTVFVVKIRFVDVRVLLANWVVVSVSVSVSVTVLPVVSVIVMNRVVVSIAVPRSGGLPGTSGEPVGGTAIVVVLVLLDAPPGGVTVTVLVIGFRHPSVGRVTVRVSVLGFGLGEVTVDSRVVVYNVEGSANCYWKGWKGCSWEYACPSFCSRDSTSFRTRHNFPMAVVTTPFYISEDLEKIA